MKKPPLRPSTTDREGRPLRHFFASSMATWKVSYDLQYLIATLKREGYPFAVYSVPGPIEQSYEIKMFTPQVEGTQHLVTYE